MTVTTSILTILVPIALLFILTVVVTVFTKALKSYMDTGIDKLRLSPSWPEILSMAQQAVRFAEQLKLTGKVADVGEVVKAEAIKALQAFLVTQGWGSLDVVALDALIESAYNELHAELDRKVPELDTWAQPLMDYTYTTTTGSGVIPTAKPVMENK